MIAHSPNDWHLEDRFLPTMENATIIACDFFLFFHIIFFQYISFLLKCTHNANFPRDHLTLLK